MPASTVAATAAGLAVRSPEEGQPCAQAGP